MTKYGKAIIGGYVLLTLVFLIAGFYKPWYFLAAVAVGGGGGYFLYRYAKPKQTAGRYP